MSSKKNIVLLATDGLESQAKVKQYTKAARAIGLGLRSEPDSHTVGIFPCSDYLSQEASWLCHSYGIPGPDPLAVTIATNKSFAYRFLQDKGYDSLSWFIPLLESDFRIKFKRPIIVKPEKGSGSFGVHPWGYRVFKSLADFKAYLEHKRLMKAFLAWQAEPSSATGRYIIMEYVDSEEIYSVAAIVGDNAIKMYDSAVIRNMLGTVIIDRMLMGVRHPHVKIMTAMIRQFADIGLKRAVLYLQCIEREGKLFPIDINLRPGTIWNAVCTKFELPFYSQMLNFVLGFEQEFKLELPARYIGVQRINTPLINGVRDVNFGPGCTPLINRITYNSRKPYDREHAWPMFAVLSKSLADFDRQAQTVINATLVKPVKKARHN